VIRECEWSSRKREREQMRLFERFRNAGRDELEVRLRTLEILRAWGAIDEEEFEEERRSLMGTKANSGRASKRHRNTA
jgi:hypothetical protein